MSLAENTNVVAGALFELRFWLQIFGDHARFIHDSLGPDEAAAIISAKQFIQAYDQALAQARTNLSQEGIATLMNVVNPLTSQLRVFKLHLLQRSLTGHIVIHLTQTFLSHMVNELEEGMRVFAALTSGQLPLAGPAIHQHLVWLQDAIGHAGSLAADFDFIEKSWIKHGEEFEKCFQALFLKAIELAGYLRTGLADFPALRRFNQEADSVMLIFMKFLTEIQELTASKELLGTITVLIPDHMFREECYYLTKLSQAAQGISRPDCDPAKPRAEG